MPWRKDRGDKQHRHRDGGALPEESNKLRDIREAAHLFQNLSGRRAFERTQMKRVPSLYRMRNSAVHRLKVGVIPIQSRSKSLFSLSMLRMRFFLQCLGFLSFGRRFGCLSLLVQGFRETGVGFGVIRVETERFSELHDGLIDVAVFHL